MKTAMIKTTLPWLVAVMLGGCAVDGAEPQDDPADEETTGKTSSALFGSDACRNTDITVVNRHTENGAETNIEVRRLEYYSSSEGRWYTENVANTVINHNFQMTWNNEDLEHAENDRITQWRVSYRWRINSGAWSTYRDATINTPDVTCLANTQFSMTLN